MKIIFCLPGNSFSGEFLVAWTQIAFSLREKGHQIFISQAYSSFVSFSRAKCLGGNSQSGENQKPFGGNVDYDVMIWMDSDILAKEEHIYALLDSPHDVTCGLYKMDDNIHFAVIEKWDEEFYKDKGHFEFMTEKDVVNFMKKSERYVQVAYSGMGMMAIKKGAVEKITYPWFFYDLQRMGTIVEMCSEDVALCRKFKDANIPIFLDINLRVGHQKRVTLM
jgi:hypothetical protein